MIEQGVEITTPDGRMPTFVARPDGDGPFPVLLVLMDGLGMREALRQMARERAARGAYVMLPDLYYRAGPITAIERDRPGDWDRMMELVRGLGDDMVLRDVDALLAHAARDPAARPGPAAVMGFCMGGRLSVVVAQGLGERIAAAAGIHPGNLVSDGDDSPHRHLDRVSAEVYLAIADQDEWCTPDQVARMEKALVAAGVHHQVEWHPGALHGFGVPGSAVYHEPAAQRVHERIDALLGRALG